MPEISPLRKGDPEGLGPYRLIGLLGEGGQGTVYLGEEEEKEGAGGRRVAVKLLHARLTGDAKARARFAAELQVTRRVAEFCTAPVLDADVDGDRPYIVSEYIDGPSLSAVLATDDPLAGMELDRLAIGTMTALAAIHQAGVVHRDFKPANVLLAPDGPRVIDFGISRALDATGTLSSTAVGTPVYMAPEQISGGPIGPQADIWAWGVTMIYAATGRAAFGQDSIPTVMHRILNFPPDLGSLTEPLRGLVTACLNKQAAYRPSSQQVLTHLLALAGSLPNGPDGGAAQTPEAAMLNQGREAASTRTNVRLVSPFQFAPPPPPQQPPPPWGVATVPSTPKPPRKPGIGVLAGAGSAALVALIVIVTATIVQFRGDDSPTTGGGTSAGRTGGQLAITLDTATSGSALSPAGALYGTERIVAKHLFTGLAEVTPSGTLRNRLATRITPNADCTTWTIGVRSGTTFSNGEPLGAEAFVRGWNRAAPDTNGLASVLIGGIKGFDDVQSGKSQQMSGLRASGDTITAELSEPDCEFGKRLGDPTLAPVPADAGAHDNRAYNERPVGNGPFKLEAYSKDRSITLVRNDAWAFGKTKLDRVNISLVADVAAAGRAGFEAGEVEWVPLQAHTLASARGSRGLVNRTSMGLNYLIPIAARGPMKSREARLAVSYALDRQALSSSLFAGTYPAATGLLPPAIGGRRGVCESCERHDPARAKQLAGQAGLPSGTKINLYTRDTPTQRRWAEVARNQLQTVLGWTVELKLSPAGDFTGFTRAITADDAEGLATSGWLPDYPSAYSLLQPLLSSEQATDTGGTNYARWQNTEFDQLLAQARRTTDDSARVRLLQQAEKLALDDLALVPVVFLGNAALRSDRLTGLEMDIDGLPTLATAAYK